MDTEASHHSVHRRVVNPSGMTRSMQVMLFLLAFSEFVTIILVTGARNHWTSVVVVLVVNLCVCIAHMLGRHTEREASVRVYCSHTKTIHQTTL